MKRSSAVGIVVSSEPVAGTAADEGAVAALRRRLASGSAREHVVLDFLDEDLREAHTALTGVAAWLANVERALADDAPSQHQLTSLALGAISGERVDALSSAVSSVRRRLAQVAARM